VNIALFYHSLISDWNHGSAHFLRGVVRELGARGHRVSVYEPAGGWSVANLVADHGLGALAAFHAVYPGLDSHRYDDRLDLDAVLDDVDLAIVHEWTDPAVVARIGAHHRAHPRYTLLFHDTRHRVSDAELAQYDLRDYDGVLAFGRALRDIYRERGLALRAWTWHEAADIRVFSPQPRTARDGDLVWIGNWGNAERVAEVGELLIGPVTALGLDARVHGVRYPPSARAALVASGIEYGGWIPNFLVPLVFARFAVTIHLPRARGLPGIPAIRAFEALACGIPLITGPWSDDEQLFIAGHDYLVAHTGTQMRRHLRAVLHDEALAASLAANGRATILARHTCAHRVDQLLALVRQPLHA
jgi:spore maturation protein CgeB